MRLTHMLHDLVTLPMIDGHARLIIYLLLLAFALDTLHWWLQ